MSDVRSGTVRPSFRTRQPRVRVETANFVEAAPAWRGIYLAHSDWMLFLGDLRYAVRSLVRTPSLLAALLVSLALGVGSNAIVLSFSSGLLQPRVPVPAIDRVVSIVSRDGAGALTPLSFDDYQRIASGSHAFASLAAVRESESQVEFGGRTVLAASGEMTASLFEVLQFQRRDGVYVTRRFWEDELDGAAGVTGQTVRVDGRDLPLAGFVSTGFDGLYAGREIDLWLPLDEHALPSSERTSRAFWVVGRLASGATARQAETELAQRTGAPFVVVPYTGVEPDVAGGFAKLRTLLPLASIVVFLVACANVASLLLSRAFSRTHETSVRVALGASGGRLARHLLADAVLISVGGAGAGTLVALWTTRIVPALLFAEDAEQLTRGPDIASVAAGIAVCVILTTICGLAPLGEIRDRDPAAVLRRESGGLSNASRRLRAGLVSAQMACCCLLLVSTGVLLHGFEASLRTTTGARLANTVLATVESAGPRSFFRDAEAAALRTPGVSSVVWTSALPGDRPVWQQVRVEPPVAAYREINIQVGVLPPKPPAVMVLPVASGRMFSGGDGPGTCGVVMVNAAAAALFGGPAVGRALIDPAARSLDVVGVVNVRPAPKAAAPTAPIVYYYENQGPPPVDPSGRGRFRVPSSSGDATDAVLDAHVVSTSYFAETGARLTAGVTFADLPSGACRVAMVNDVAEARYFSGHAAGRTVIDEGGRIQIIGVVHVDPVRVTARRAEPSIFFPMSQRAVSRMTIMLRTTDSSVTTLRTIRDHLDRVPSSAGAADVRTLERHLARTSLAPERIATTLVAVCAASAMVLCVIGVYGAMADSVRRRRRDYAVRGALGAPWWRVMGAVLGEGLGLATVGALVGGAASLLIARWLGTVTPGAGAAPLWVWFAAPVCLGVVVVAGGLVPARRAIMVDPLVVMREE